MASTTPFICGQFGPIWQFANSIRSLLCPLIKVNNISWRRQLFFPVFISAYGQSTSGFKVCHEAHPDQAQP